MKTRKPTLSLLKMMTILSLVLSLAACAGEGTVTVPFPPTEIVLTVTSNDSAVKEVELKFRNLDYVEETIGKRFGEDRDITEDPVIVALQPSISARIGEPFLIIAWGYNVSGEEIVAGSGVFEFVQYERVYRTILMETFTDDDRDGFEPCAAAPDGTCDCNDSHDHVNPLTREICSDSLDNNCDGQDDEGCP